MFSTTATYFRQRFSYLWIGLGVFLHLYIFGFYAFEFRRFVLFPFIVVLLFILRLFDDLENREDDLHKQNRIYTSPGKYFELRRLLSITIPVYLFFTLWLHKYFAVCIGIFLFINLLLYQNLHKKQQWRYVLPLLKYPFICLAFGALVNGFSLHLLLLSTSLFAAFLLFENLSDDEFQLANPVKILLFLFSYSFLFTAGFSPFVFAMLFFVVALNYYIAFYSRLKLSPYIFLAILLLTRLFYAYEF